MYDSDSFSDKYRSWIFDGGSPTEEAFMELDSESQKKILLYMSYMPIFEETQVNGNKFFLSHTVPGCDRMQDRCKLLWQEFIIGEPEYEKEYFPDKFIVTGHTPTGFIDPKCKGKIWRGNNHIAIDCGAVFGNPLGCICLDTLEEFYV
jgi:serine/threonine protein phosphatase 1